MHFGLYLHRNGIITADELVAALEVQTKRLVPIGQLALEEGILSARNIFDILRAQHDAPHERFGELAIEMGLLRRDDLMRLLMIQADRKLPIGQILVWQGVLTEQQVDEALNDFRQIQSQPRTATTTVIRPPQARAPQRAIFDTVVAT
ncbi:MAG: hypothetical protein WD669_01365 [Pirellulales bacterium]